MEKDRLAKRLLATFLGEMQDHVQALERDLLLLEKHPSADTRAELFRTLFRAAHSLKGAARTVNIDAVEAACHELEGIFSATQRQYLPLDASVFQTLFAATDALGEAALRLRDGRSLEGAPIAGIIPRLASIVSDLEHKKKPIASQAPIATLPAARRSDYSDETGEIRVPASKLDILMLRSGDLLLSQGRIQRRIQDVARIQELVKELRREQRAEPARKASRAYALKAGALHVDSVRGPAARSGRVRSALRAGQESVRRMELDLQNLERALVEDARTFQQLRGQIEEEIRRIRMVPFATACERLDRTIRDLAVKLGKRAELVVQGQDIELDRSILEGLKAPLLHLVRNAVDHGIEEPEARRAAGKPETGRIVVDAALRDGMVEVSVTDDGRGIDIVAVRERAHKSGLPVPEDDRDLVKCIFLPGFSTVSTVTQLSGRGVGLDVAKASVEAMRGMIDASVGPGSTTRFTFTLPLTLTTIRGLLVATGGSTYVVDSSVVRKLVRVKFADLHMAKGRQMLALGDSPIPVVALADILRTEAARAIEPNSIVSIAVLSFARREAAIIVEDLLAEQDVVIQSLGPQLDGIRTFAGATVLPDGSVAPILNTATLIERALTETDRRSIVTGDPVRVKTRLLVADDSVTTRTLEKSILEAAGYEVIVAADGAEAWRLLNERGVSLVVTDVEMPHMDGFALTEAIRGSKRFKDLPVILVTALESEKDKARGLAAGADAYLLKSSFDQRQLLHTIKQIL